MNLLNLILISSAVTGIATKAHAQDSGLYLNLGAEAVEFESYNLTARLGYQFTEIFSVEGQANFGVIKDDEFIKGSKIGAETSFAAFVRGSVPISENFSVFARGGYHFAEQKIEGNGFDESLDYDGFAYGAGLEYMLNESNALRADLTFMETNIGIPEVFNLGGVSEHYAVAYVRKF